MCSWYEGGARQQYRHSCQIEKHKTEMHSPSSNGCCGRSLGRVHSKITTCLDKQTTEFLQMSDGHNLSRKWLHDTMLRHIISYSSHYYVEVLQGDIGTGSNSQAAALLATIVCMLTGAPLIDLGLIDEVMLDEHIPMTYQSSVSRRSEYSRIPSCRFQPQEVVFIRVT